MILDSRWTKCSGLSYLQDGVVAEQRAAHRRGAAVAVDQLAAFLAPAPLFLQRLQAPLGCHSICARGQVAQRNPDGLRVVPHAAAVCHGKMGNYQCKTLADWCLVFFIHGLKIVPDLWYIRSSHCLLCCVSKTPRMTLIIPQRQEIPVFFVCMWKLELLWRP